MKEIFISYSTVDSSKAESVRNILEENGFSCWMAPRDIPTGSNYTKEIPVAIRNCSIFVLMLSENAQSSHWVLKELDSAVNSGKVILPFMLEECSLNDEFNFLLTGTQRYAAYQKKSDALETLINRIHAILGTGTDNYAHSDGIAEQTSKAASNESRMDLDRLICPACSSSDLKVLRGRIKRSGLFELSTMLLIPVLAIASSFIFLIIASFVLPYDMFDLVLWLILIGGIIGGVAGELISRTVVTRRRLRRHLPNVCYRCNTCKKVFLGKK